MAWFCGQTPHPSILPEYREMENEKGATSLLLPAGLVVRMA
jgi:hypothetical protein